MPATSAMTGQGTLFSIGDGVDGGSVTYTKVGEVLNVPPPAQSRESHDATHLESPDDYKEFIPGLKSGENTSITFNYVPSASDVLQARYNTGKGDFRITYTNGVTLTFSAVVTGWKAGDGSSEKMIGELTLQQSGGLVAA